MIGHPDERDLERWANADLAALRDDLDHVLNADTGSSSGLSAGSSGVPPSSRPLSDAELIEAVRGGEIQAYGQLFERHVRAARTLARHLAWSSAEADDLVSDAFAKVLDTVRAGGGPDSAFRAYLLTALRHTAYDKTRRDKKLRLADDVEAVSGVEKVTTVPFHDPAVATLERALATRAFASLPERWQTVLWQTEIEGQSAAELAKLLGLTANGASALAYRAREGLKTAYLQAHLADNATNRCRATVAKLAAWTRGGLTKRETAQVEAHLDECTTCRAMAAELADVNGTLRAVVAPLVLGTGVSGYLATTAGTAKAGSAAASLAATSVTTTAQWLGVAASATAVVAALALGLNTARPVVPTVDAQPPPATADQQPPDVTSSSLPVTGSVPGTGSGGPSVTTTESADQPAGPVPSGAPTTTTTVEAPAQPLVPVVPAGFTMATGGPPVELPVTVRNTGSTPLAPTTLVLTLPEGVQVVGAGRNLRGRPLVRFDGAARVGCPAGKGTVTCTTEAELPAGGSVTFVFRLLAGPKSVGGTIRGTVTAGSAQPVPVDVPLTVTPR
ncbi:MULTISPECIES: sigma-70 family RNA polymerase sigma factor [Saccharothrix]|uniref:sigma-70 family RNA polymerase sigma factor n=1 Tax=Saccharothrix TaxID=2071 RepID=UPI00093E2C95|nr:sigma-70 family RNA polymerase sigma factor [Saccharothrix sp. CB00851]OKI23204.1 hypothetical protein A6A25_35355 [Saccharothrix sp. CB00851]